MVAGLGFYLGVGLAAGVGYAVGYRSRSWWSPAWAAAPGLALTLVLAWPVGTGDCATGAESALACGIGAVLAVVGVAISLLWLFVTALGVRAGRARRGPRAGVQRF